MQDEVESVGEAEPEHNEAQRPTNKGRKRVGKKARDTRKYVVLFRHGLAEEKGGTKSDEERSLTTEGHDKTKRAARGLTQVFPRPDALFSSPLLRALQSALWLTKAYKNKVRVQTTDALVPDAKPEELLEVIRAAEGNNLVFVGHEPNLTENFASLIGLDASVRADLRKAGAIGIRIEADGTGTLEWMLTPRMLRRIS